MLPIWHFGVLVDGERVVHLGPGYGVELLRLHAFGPRVSLAFRSADPRGSVRRAMSRIGEQGTFHPLLHNCQHFAEWCVGERA